jgi:hypothetical protein
MQTPAQLKRNKGLHSSFYAYFKSYQGIHFHISLFLLYIFFFKFTIVRSDEGRKRENVSFWGTPTLENLLPFFNWQFQATLQQIHQQQWLMFYFQKRINLSLLVILQSLPWTIKNHSRYRSKNHIVLSPKQGHLRKSRQADLYCTVVCFHVAYEQKDSDYRYSDVDYTLWWALNPWDASSFLK